MYVSWNPSRHVRFIRNEEYSLEAASDDLLHHLASVRYQRNTPVVAALCTILLPVGYHDNDISPHIRHPPPPPNTKTIWSSLHRKAGSPLRETLNSSTRFTPSCPTAFFPFAYERVTYVSSWIVGQTFGDACFVHWSRPLAIRGSIGVIYSPSEIVHESSWLYVCMYV